MKMNSGNASIMRSSSFAHAQIDSPRPAPTPRPSANHGSTIDQGIAYVLLFGALALTYFLH